MRKLKVYYAHSLHLYGSAQEARDVKLLEDLGFEVVNPNIPEHQLAYKASLGGMYYFKELAKGCDALAFRAYPDGKIGAGVFTETMEMGEKPVIELPSGMFRRGLSVEDTREYLKELGQR